jgi:hypothetical protein
MAQELFINHGLWADYPTLKEFKEGISRIQDYKINPTRSNSVCLIAADVATDPNVDVELEIVGQDTAEWARGLMSVLSQRQKQVISLRFGIGEGDPKPLSQNAVSKALEVSREKIKELEASALKKMKLAALKQKEDVLLRNLGYEIEISETARAIQDLILEPQREREER